MGPKARITRDVRMVYTLFIEELRGATPGRSYVVKFSRGEKISGSTRIHKADKDGIVPFKYVSEFTATLQMKSSDAYKKKDVVLQAFDMQLNRLVCEVRFNIAAVVVNETVPLKQLMSRSDTGEETLWFGLSAVSEDSKVATRGSPKGAQQQRRTPADTAHSSAEDDDDFDSSVIDDAIEQANSGRRQHSGRKASSPPAPSPSRTGTTTRNDNSAQPPQQQRPLPARQPSPTEDFPPPSVTVKKSRVRTDSANFGRDSLDIYARRDAEEPEQAARAAPPAAAPRTTTTTTTTTTASTGPPPVNTSKSAPAASNSRQQSPAAGAARPGDVTENARWLAAIADAAAAMGSTVAAVREGENSSSLIPRAALLMLSPLRRWTGERRLLFTYDLILYLYQDVLRHTRHFGAWINILVHVLYDCLNQVEPLEEEEQQRQQEEDEQQIADELLELLNDRDLINNILQKSYVAPTARDNELTELLRDWISIEVPASAIDKMGSNLVVIVSVTIDDVLRRLCGVVAKRPLTIVKEAAVPPTSQPAWATADGFTLAAPILKAAELAKRAASVHHHMVDDARVALVLQALGTLHDELLPSQSATHPPLLRLCVIEIFKLATRNITAAFMNNMFKDGVFVVRSARDALHLKLAVSLIERWLQEHALFLACRTELLPLRQFIDIAILQKKVLAVQATRHELSTQLPAPLVYHFLRQFEPNPRDLEADTVPEEVFVELRDEMRTLRATLIDAKMKAAKAAGEPSDRRRIEAEAETESGTVTPWKYATLGSFPFFDFLYGLLPNDDGDDAPRKSMRKSVRQSIRRAHRDVAEPFTSDGKAAKGKAGASVALDWDVQFEHLTVGADSLDAVLYGNDEQQQNKEFANLRLAAMSLANAEQLDEIVPI